MNPGVPTTDFQHLTIYNQSYCIFTPTHGLSQY